MSSQSTPADPKHASVAPNSIPEAYTKFINEFARGKWNPAIDRVTNGPAGPRRRALLIVMMYRDRYPPAPLMGAYVDAYEVIQTLVDKFGFSHDEICVLADIAIPQYTASPERRPSQDIVMEKLGWLSKGSSDGDTLFLYVVGHGTRRTEKHDGKTITVEGIMLDDVQFIKYDQCEDCDCGVDELNFELPTSNRVIPDPLSVLWAPTIRNILARHLGDGANLAAVFECDNGGGPLADSSNYPEHLKVEPGIRGLSNPLGENLSPHTAPRVPLDRRQKRADARPSDSPPLGGNFLCLPLRADPGAPIQGLTQEMVRSGSGESDFDPENDQVTKNDESDCWVLEAACKPYIKSEPVIRNFGRSSRVHSWSACGINEDALEDGYQGSRFTKAFLDCLNNKTAPTYRYISNHLQNVIRHAGYETRTGTIAYQNPQLYFSASTVLSATRSRSLMDDVIPL